MCAQVLIFPLFLFHYDTPHKPKFLPFVNFLGLLGYGFTLTGENAAIWEHSQSTAPMFLLYNITALSFAGSQMLGFFGNNNAKLMTW